MEYVDIHTDLGIYYLLGIFASMSYIYYLTDLGMWEKTLYLASRLVHKNP